MAAENAIVRRRSSERPASSAEAVALETEDLGVVDEAVDHRGGDHVVAEC
jgi:hypothetical protein